MGSSGDPLSIIVSQDTKTFATCFKAPANLSVPFERRARNFQRARMPMIFFEIAKSITGAL